MRYVLAYRQVLAVPRVPATMLLMFFARLPMTAMGITLTLHVVTDLGRGYGAAGLVGTATTLGSALGAPLVGRMIDRYGLRPVVAVCGSASAVYWVSAPHLPYPVLVAVTLPAGMLALPATSIARQALTALVPPTRRRSAYSLDSISLESSFMIGPAAGIAVATQFSAGVALTGIGLFFALTTVALCWYNPPVRHEDEVVTGSRPRVREWLGRRLSATLLFGSGALFCLIGTELATLAALRSTGEIGWTGLVIVVMCVASATGGIVYGALHRSLSQSGLMLALTVLVLPVGLFGHPWWLLALALVPTNLLCAPTLTATTEEVAALAPARVRAEAMGLLDSATRLGMALGSPVVGFVIDHSSAAAGFAAAGLGGLVLAAAGYALRLRVGWTRAVNA
ncbi:Predicted arabinose efflux permease, MFS family [Amycolatopsis sacchari]|uniref:Predicted arabinose efflux permease, MFS family n=2 Tax=Pseudonocardiaceae TaxID=2070 RepID=A0A1I3U2Z1_9PSEU|nr:Predicted arabinose efflux permease, MFS family [Amycolatopsis sacchari]